MEFSPKPSKNLATMKNHLSVFHDKWLILWLLRPPSLQLRWTRQGFPTIPSVCRDKLLALSSQNKNTGLRTGILVAPPGLELFFNNAYNQLNIEAWFR
jgi:hypothetical protein